MLVELVSGFVLWLVITIMPVRPVVATDAAAFVRVCICSPLMFGSVGGEPTPGTLVS